MAFSYDHSLRSTIGKVNNKSKKNNKNKKKKKDK